MTQAVALPALTGGDLTLSGYMEKISKYPYLSQEEEFMLAKRLVEHGDVAAAHTLVTSHLRLVAKIASGFKGYGLPMLEVISEGNIGLMQAVKKFDPDKGYRLSTYAMWWIKASIQEYVLRSWSLVKLGTTNAQKKLFFNLKRLKSRLHKVDNNALSPEEVAIIANELDVSEQDVTDMNARISYADQSLNAPVHGDEQSDEMINYLEEEGQNQEMLLAHHDELDYKRGLFNKALSVLNDREQAILMARRMQEPPLTLEDLSQEYGISRERVRQIEARSFEKLQAFIQENAA